MTFLDMIEMYNIQNGKELNDIYSMYEDIVLDNRVDKEVLVGALLDECGAMRCLYETTATFKYFSDNFFKKYAKNIEKMWDTLEYEYDPLVNKELEWVEETDITQNLDTEENRKSDSEESRNKDNTGTQGNVYEETNTVSAMNSDNYSPDNKSNSNNTRTDNFNEQIDTTKSDQIDATKNEDLTWDETDSHKEKGIVNVAYQDLIEKERRVAEFNVYNWISKKYAKELFLLIY